MNSVSKVYLIVLLMLFLMPGCSNDSIDSIDTPEYEGRPLVIGVIGEPPEVREENVSFRKMTFKQLKELHAPADLDAVFITKEHLPEAADNEYSKTYKTSGIPFFFIESKKSYLPFTHDDLSFEDVPDLSTDTYATGYYQIGEKYRYWGYGLYNDKVNYTNIMDVYTRIFLTIESIDVE